jgi:peptidylprolyl isomerase
MGWLKKLLRGGGSTSAEDVTAAPTPVKESDYSRADTGLLYFDLVKGTGDSPSKGNNVTVHYTGWLQSGRRFDSSRTKNRPFSFVIGRRKVIRGWDEGVMSMKVGGIRQLKIPPSLGYGAVGSPPVIPKNATLIFEVELLEIQ